jgi:hypothetical protein
VLGLSGRSDWLLGQEGEVPGCSAFDIGFLPVGCAGSTVATAKGTTSRIVVDADADSDAGIPEGYSA